MPFIANYPAIKTAGSKPFIADAPVVSPEELETQQAVEARTEAVKSRLNPMAYARGAVQGISDFAGQVSGAAGELAGRMTAPPDLKPDLPGTDASRVAGEAVLRGAADLGQLGKDVFESQVLDPYRVLRRAVAEEGFLPTVDRAVENAWQLAGPSMDRTLSMLQVFPRQAAAVIREAQARDAAQAADREALQKGDRSLLGEVVTSVADLATGGDTTIAEKLGKAVTPPKDLAQTTELASMVADPGLLQSRAVRLGTRIGEKVAPGITKKLGTPILEMGGKAATIAKAQQAKGSAARIAENNRKAWEEAAQRSDETAPPLQTPSIQLTPPSESKRAQSLFAKKAAEAAQAGPGAIQRGIGAAGRAAETGGKLVERAAGKVGELADKYEGTLSAASAVAGASSGPLGALAGSQVPEAIRKAARWSENASRAGTALRTVADADWDSSIPVWRQIAKDPNAPQWLVRGVTANVVGKLKAGQMVETGLRVGSDLGKGVVEGAATDALLTGLDTSKSGEEIGGEAGVGGLLGGAGTLPALRRMSRERKALAFAYDSMRKASESIQAGADPLVVASTPDELMHSSVILEQTFQGMLAGRQDLKVDLMDAAQFAKSSKDPNAAAYFDESTGRVAVNLEAVDAAGRQLHEIGHALMASVAASNPAIIQHFRQALGPDGMARARQDYQQALGRTIPQDDAFIVGELFSEAMANGLRGVNLNEALPVVLGRTDTQSFFRDADVRKVLKDPATLDLVRQQFQAASDFRPAVDMEKEPGVKLRPEQAGNHPALPTETRADGTQGNDFVDVVNGQTRETPVPVVRARVRNRRKEVLTLFPDVPPSGNANPQASNIGVRQGPSGLTEKTGTRLGEQFYATARSFGEGTKNMLRRVEQAIANNETMAGWYQQIGTGDGWAASVRESLGAMEAQYKDFIPFAFKVDKQGNLLVQNYSLTALDRKASDWAGRKGPLSLELWNGDLSTFKADVQTYLKNHAEGRPGSDGIGEMKRNVINVFLVGGNRTFEALNPLRPQAKGKDRQGIVRSYRADRLQTVEPSDVTGYQKPDYSKQVRNLSPQVVPPEQLELNFNKAVNQLGTEEALAPEKPSPAPRAPRQPKDAPTTFSITASRIKRLLKRGPVNPIGMSAATAQDRHAVAALFRNPAFEAMRWVFVKEGKVVAVANTTVRQPDAVHLLTKGLDIDQLSKMAVASGADSLFWTHNHPSGISTPSEPDVRATQAILSWAGFRGSPLATLRFLGHVVTNHTDHHIISTWGDVARVQVPAPGPDKWLNKPIWDAEIVGPSALARVGAAFANPNNPSRMILFLDPRKYIKAVGEISPNIDSKKFAEEVRKFAIANGASSAVAYGSFESDAVMFEQLVRDGILDDAFIPGFGGLRDAMMRPPRLFETPPREASEDQLVTSPDEKLHFSPQVDRNLVALHNTTEEGIRAALKLGGIPVPSLGITKKDTAFTGFGDITLIADKSAIDPQADPRNKVYNADVYSPRQPRPFQAVKRGARDRLSKRMKELLPKGFQTWSDLAPGERAYDMVVEKGENNVLETRRKLAGAPDVQAAFLTQRGIEVPRLMKDPNLRNRSLSREQLADPRLAVLSQHSSDLYDFLQTPEGIAAGDAVRDLAVAGRMSDLEGITEEQKQRLNGLMEKSYGARGTPFPFRYISDIVDDLATVAKNEQEVDRYGIQDWIREQLTPLKAEFEQWVDGLVADTFETDQKLLSGRTKKPYALDTLVEEMSGDPRAREKGMTYSLGKARSDSAKALPSLEAVRSERGSLTDSESMRAFKDAQSREFSELSDRLQYFNPEAGAFERLDRLSEAVGKAAKRPATTGALLSAAGFKRVPDSLVKAVRDFATKLATAPTEYFEAKPQRAVTLNEFRAAVVPESTSPEVVDALKQAGLAVETYTDNANRVATVERLSTEKDLLFSPKVESPEFQRWFKGSKVVGKDGAPSVMYHSGSFDENQDPVPNIGKDGFHFGTKQAAEERVGGKAFEDAVNSESVFEEGGRFYLDENWPQAPSNGFASESDARTWLAGELVDSSMEDPQTTLTSAYLSIKNPKRVLDAGQEWEPVIAQAKAEGYDGIVYRNKFEDRGKDSWIAFYPTQIKSTSNRGTFDTNNPDIRFSPAVTPDPKYLVRVPGATVKAEKMGVSAITDEMAEVNTAMAAAATKEEKKALRAKLKELSQSKQNLVPLVSYTMPTLAKSLPKNSLAGAKNQTELQKVFFGRLDAAVDRVRNDPTRFVDPAGYVEFMRTAGVSGNVLMPPPGAELLLNNPQQYVALVTGAYHGPKTAAGTIAAAMSGLDSTVAMRQAIQARVQGASQFVAPPPMVTAMHHLWGVLSRRLAPIHQEASWLRLVSQPEVLEHIQKSIDGTLGPDFTQDAWNAIVSRAYKATAQPGNLLGNSATSNANSFYLMLSRWNGAWDKVSDVYATPSSREMGRRFWSLNRGSVGIKNKVQRFVGLTFGIPGLIMDRWKFVEFFMGQFGKAPQDYFKYTSTGTPEDVASIYGGYGPIENADPTFSLAFYEGMETVLQAAIDRSQDIKNLLGNHPNVGGLHWVGWNAIKNEAVGHSSLDLTHDLLQHSDITPDAVLAQVRAKQYYTEGLDGSTLKRFTLKP